MTAGRRLEELATPGYSDRLKSQLDVARVLRCLCRRRSNGGRRSDEIDSLRWAVLAEAICLWFCQEWSQIRRLHSAKLAIGAAVKLAGFALGHSSSLVRRQVKEDHSRDD